MQCTKLPRIVPCRLWSSKNELTKKEIFEMMWYHSWWGATTRVPNFAFHLFFKNGPIPASFSVYFRLFNMLQLEFTFKLIKELMVCLWFEPGVAGLKARTNPLSYGSTLKKCFIVRCGPSSECLIQTETLALSKDRTKGDFNSAK